MKSCLKHGFVLISMMTVIFSLSYTKLSFAAVVFDNGSSLSNSGMWSDYDPRYVDGTTFYIQAGDIFTLPYSSTIQSIKWWGWNIGTNLEKENNFTIYFYEFENGVPKTSPFYTYRPNTFQREPVVPGYPGQYEYLANINPITLNPYTTYLLSIVNVQ